MPALTKHRLNKSAPEISGDSGGNDMEINAIQNYMRVQPAVTTGRAVRPAADVAAAAETTRSDKVDFSSQASFKAQLGASAKQYAMQSTETASAERISQLKQQYQGDACPVSGTDIASAIMKYTIGGAIKVD